MIDGQRRLRRASLKAPLGSFTTTKAKVARTDDLRAEGAREKPREAGVLPSVALRKSTPPARAFARRQAAAVRGSGQPSVLLDLFNKSLLIWSSSAWS